MVSCIFCYPMLSRMERFRDDLRVNLFNISGSESLNPDAKSLGFYHGNRN